MGQLDARPPRLQSEYSSPPLHLEERLGGLYTQHTQNAIIVIVIVVVVVAVIIIIIIIITIKSTRSNFFTTKL